MQGYQLTFITQQGRRHQGQPICDWLLEEARYALAFAFAMGCLLSLSRMLQGAHFLSHNLWTMLFDWLICLGLYRLMLYRPETRGQRNGGADENRVQEVDSSAPSTPNSMGTFM